VIQVAFFDYTDSPYVIRNDFGLRHREYWEHLASPGSWWTGEQRIAIAQESRNARNCDFCRERKQALSPYTMKGTHDQAGTLSEVAVDAVHRVVTDQDRITQSYVDDLAQNGVSDAAYVELVGVIVAVLSIDEFHRALGLPLEDLPNAIPGEPDRYRPTQAVKDIGFVPTLPRDGATGNEADLWSNGGTANVLRALTLVPDALRHWRALARVQYLSLEGMANFGKAADRSINRMQMELVAGRVSAINQCFY
tara:strand:- start:1239 stop:1991 length:753 start_codon:yes stop_codon:yes gene_type:complete